MISLQSKTALRSAKTDKLYFWKCCQLLFSDDVMLLLPTTEDDGSSRQLKSSFSHLCVSVCVCVCTCACSGMRQGNDVGTTYRSAIYTYTKQHLDEALASKDEYQKVNTYIHPSVLSLLSPALFPYNLDSCFSLGLHFPASPSAAHPSVFESQKHSDVFWRQQTNAEI